MKRLYKLVALLAVSAGALTAGVTGYSLFSRPTVRLSTSSPDRTYTVELTGNKSRSLYHAVRFNVIKHGQATIEDAYAHSGDWMDISFELAYPEQAWVGENVLRFWREPERPERAGFDTLLIANKTNKAIKYLRVSAEDLFLVFDIQPGSTSRLSPSHQSWQSWVDCNGEFEDGRRIRCDGVNFSHHDKSNEPLRYRISVTDGRVAIESSQTEGYDI